MPEEFKNIIRVASIYMATIIGAGFASGQEIVQFFSTYEKGGFLGVILAGLLFSVIGCLVLDRVYRDRIRNYGEFIYPMMGLTVGRVVEAAATVFMLCLFFIMVAGAGNIISEKLSIPYYSAVLIMSIICMLFIFTSIQGIVTLSTVITPVLIIGILFTGLYILIFRDVTVFSIADILHGISYNWFASAILYVGYNSIMSIMVMTGLLPYLKTRRTARLGGILGGIMLCIVAFILNAALYINYSGAASAELPVLHILGKYDRYMSILYAVLLWLAMLVSAATSGYCFVDRVCSRTGKECYNRNRKRRFIITAGVCAAAVPLSAVGFSRLISLIYPLFGYLGLFIAAVILLQGLRDMLAGRSR